MKQKIFRIVSIEKYFSMAYLGTVLTGGTEATGRLELATRL